MRRQLQTSSTAGCASSSIPASCRLLPRSCRDAARLAVLCLVAPALGCGRDGPSGATSAVASGSGLHGCPSSDAPQCSHGDANPTDVPATPNVAPSTEPKASLLVFPCVGTLAEYCASYGGQCPTYRESLERDEALCARQPYLSVTKRACGHTYQSVGWQAPLLGGRDEYFDAGGRLIGAHLFSDYGAYCNGTSFDQTFGKIPTCATRPLEVRLCPARR